MTKVPPADPVTRSADGVEAVRRHGEVELDVSRQAEHFRAVRNAAASR